MSLRSGSPWTRTIEAELLLKFDDRGDLGLHPPPVLGVVDLAGPQRGARGLIADVCGYDPMVVVGSAGRRSRSSYAARRSSARATLRAQSR
jgi:hypothetical protein